MGSLVENKKTYNYMESVLQNINKTYISLSDDEVKRNNKVLEEILNQITSKMKEKNELFKNSYSRVFYGGSYYDGLRVGNPEEFDLDLLMTLPKVAEPTLTNSNKPGFLHLQLKEFDKFLKRPEASRYPGLVKLLDDKHYLVTNKVSSWIEGLVTKALTDFPKAGSATIITTTSGTFKVTIHKGGPAHTLKLQGTVAGKQVIMDVDLVPCFVFTKEKWPSTPYRPNPVTEKSDFFIVPKRPGGNEDVTRYWRLSFQEQERVLINRYQMLKPTLKLLKKLRDIMDHKIIASYYIKTVFLWEVEQNKELWSNSMSYVFMTMLKKYKDFIENGKIPYFWNKNNNLLDKASPITLKNVANKLRNIIDDIEKHPEDSFVIAKYLVKPSKMEQLKSETVIGKKTLKVQLQQSFNGSNNTTPVLIKASVASSSACVENNFYQTKSEMLKAFSEMVENYFEASQMITLTKSRLESDVPTATTEQISCQKYSSLGAIKNSVSSVNDAGCPLDEVDTGFKLTEKTSKSVENLGESEVMKALNKLQESADRLTMTVTKLQNDNQKIFNFMQNLTVKMDDLNTNVEELKMENELLKTKLNSVDVQKQMLNNYDVIVPCSCC